MNEIKLLNDETLKQLAASRASGSPLLIIDVREPGEYAREHIAGSKNVPLSKLGEIESYKGENKKVIFHCRLGSRTRSAQQALLNTGFEEIYCMEGGIEQWKRCGLPTEINKAAPLDIMRQVQIIAGGLILISILLAYIISPYFNLLAAFVGLGLLTAGVTGFCGMAKLLLLLPYNKLNQSVSCTSRRN